MFEGGEVSRTYTLPPAPRVGSNCFFTTAVICTTRRRIPASAGQNQGSEKGGLVRRGCWRRGGSPELITSPHSGIKLPLFRPVVLPLPWSFCHCLDLYHTLTDSGERQKKIRVRKRAIWSGGDAGGGGEGRGALESVFVLIGTTHRRIPASAGTNQGSETG